MLNALHPIRVVARKTGLSPHVIRVWERRYRAVNPVRSGSNRRLYSGLDIERLSLLHRAIAAGHSIGAIAQLSEAQLERLAAEVPERQDQTAQGTPNGFVEAAIRAIGGMDTQALEQALKGAILAFGQHGLLEKVVGPLATRIGELWRDGTLMAAHEHFASAAIRNFLGRHSLPFAAVGTGPSLVVGTPSGQLHELGAVMVAAAAADLGWRVVYLGPSLPAPEIAAAAVQNKARAVALSIVYPEDDPSVDRELKSLREYLPSEIAILAGGRAAVRYAATLHEIGALRASEIKQIYHLLDQLRASGKPEHEPPGSVGAVQSAF